MQNNQELKYRVAVRLYNPQQKREFIESADVMAINETEAKLAAVYGFRKTFGKPYTYHVVSCIQLPSLIL